MGNDEECKDNIEELICEYAYIRRKFEVCKKKYSDYLAGNDNYVGIIGEYWAIKFLESLPKNQDIDITNSSSNGNKSKKWVDIELKHNEMKELISVKAISNENSKLTSGYIKYKKFNDVIQSIIVIKLDNKLNPEKLLYIDDINNNLIDGKKDYKTRWEDEEKINFKFYKEGFDRKLNDYIYLFEDNKFTKIGNQNEQ